MGQYWIPVNLDKKEFIDPHRLGTGLKLWEQMANHPGTAAALILLCAAMPEARGGGDLDKNTKAANRVVGRWAGDRIALVGDYAEEGDLKTLKGDASPKEIYRRCELRRGDEGYDPKTAWKDISNDVCAVLEKELQGKFSGDGWRQWTYKEDEPAPTPAMKPDVVIHHSRG